MAGSVLLAPSMGTAMPLAEKKVILIFQVSTPFPSTFNLAISGGGGNQYQ
jgi:hypothetical protein